MKSFLLFVAALAVMFSLVPLTAWAARGRWQDAWEAAKGYGKAMALMLGMAGALAVLLLISGGT